MNREEIIKLIKQDKSQIATIEQLSSIDTLANIIINKGITTKEEIIKIHEKTMSLMINKIVEEVLKEETKPK